MQNKAIKKIARIPHTTYCVIITVLIFTVLLTLVTAALALISVGLITLPTALIRLSGHGDFFVSDLSPLTMLFGGGFMLLGGFAVLLATVCRVCPVAAAFVFRIFSDSHKNET